METKGRLTNIAGSLRAMLRVKFSATLDFRGRDVDGRDAAIGQCLVAIAHARLSEIGRE